MTLPASDVDEFNIQGSGSWLKFRQNKIGASDAPIIMGVSPYNTPHGLMRDKLGLNTNQNAVKGKTSNWAIDRGNRWEPMARARYELINDIPMEPAVLVHPEHGFLMASLDGWNADQKRVLEIKIPGAEVFNQCLAGKVHEKYVYQLEHQLYVSSGEEAHFYCCKVESRDGKERIVDTALTIYKSNPELREKLLPKLFEFWGYMQRHEFPPLTDKDVLETKDLRAIEIFDQIGILELRINKLNTDIDRLSVVVPLDDDVKFEIKEKEKDLSELETQQFNLKKDAVIFLTHPKVKAGWVQLNQNKRFPNTWSVKIIEDSIPEKCKK